MGLIHSEHKTLCECVFTRWSR